MDLFLVTYRPASALMLVDGPTEEEKRRVGEHFQYLTRLHENGVLAMAGRTQDDGPDTVVIALVRADGPVAAQALLAADPAVANGVFVGMVQPFAFAIGGWPEPQ